MKIIFATMLLLVVAGCSLDADTAMPEKEDVPCAGAHNDGQPAYCDGWNQPKFAFLSTAHAADVEINLGDISRNTLIVGETIVDNPLQSDWHGWAEFTFITGGCNGAPTWQLMPKQARTVPAESSADVVGAGGMCTDMPLGQHQAIAKAWNADGVTLIGTAIINFNLVE